MGFVPRRSTVELEQSGLMMPKRNRVNPLGQILAIPERGQLMGNRGCLHDDQGRIVRPWLLKAWIVCLTEFKGRQREVMAPRRYTELFFLDEATALSAGHRPCFTCQRGRFRAFFEAWNQANTDITQGRTYGARELDDQLHRERLTVSGEKCLHPMRSNQLVDGVMIIEEGAPKIIWKRKLYRWSFSGYLFDRKLDSDEELEVLTPYSTVQAMRVGYEVSPPKIDV